MRRIERLTKTAGLLALLILTAASLTGCRTLLGGESEHDYLVGKGRRDITGPLSDVQMFGFVREGQTTAGVHTRLWSRAFVIAEAARPKSRLVMVTADLGSMPHEIQRDVVDRLQDEYGKLYRLDNVILAATHTHAGPGGYWHTGAGTPLGSPLYIEHYNAIVDGIVQSIVDAHESMEPATIRIAQGEVEDAGANRSRVAYLNNPDEEIAKYEHDTDRTMTLLKFTGDGGDLGTINWFAVHPTAMTYNNRLISGDHKGYAEQEFEAYWERRSDVDYEGAAFVAAFANSNCGDVTANLNLDNTGPGENEFETTRIIGGRQLDVAWRLFQNASDEITGPIESVQSYVDFSKLKIGADWTNGAGPQRTCPSAYGYAFAAGSTEDGGGHPLFQEGMLKRNAMIDSIASQMVGFSPSDEIRACHLPKVVLFAPGEMDPPGQAQVLPLGIARIGPLIFVVHPGEITTMSGRRIRETVAAAFQTTPEWVVIAAYANDFSGYTTTYEEYQTQQYEGGHTLYGPWQLAGYQQEYDRLSSELAGTAREEKEEATVDSAMAEAMAMTHDGLTTGSMKPKKPMPPAPRDLRGTVDTVMLGTDLDPLPSGEAFGQVLVDAEPLYERGAEVLVAFRTGNPQNDFYNGGNTITVERKGDEGWAPAITDRDWTTKFHWSTDPVPPVEPPVTLADVMSKPDPAETEAEDAATESEAAPETMENSSETETPASPGSDAEEAPPLMTSRATISWDIPADMEPGTYRIVFHGAYIDKRDGLIKHFDAASSRFRVR
jgi:neutral ceramidase